MKLFIKIFLLLLLPVSSMSRQSPYWKFLDKNQADSFRIALEHENNDTSLIYLNWKLGWYYQEIQRDSSLYFFQQLLSLSQKLKSKLWEAEACNGIGLALANLGNYPKSLQFLIKGQTIAGDKESEKNILMVSALSQSGNTRDARLIVLASIYHRFGILYGKTLNIKEALSNEYKSIEIANEIHDTITLYFSNMTLCSDFIALNKLDSALSYAQKSIENSNSTGFKKFNGFALSLMGNIYVKEGNYDLAKNYYRESIRINKEQENLYFLGNSYVSLANVFLMTNESDSSLYYAGKGLKVYKDIGSPEGELNAFTSLSSIYKARKNIDSAFLYQSWAMAAKDSLNNAEKIRLFQDIGFDQQLKVQQLEKEKIETQNKTRIYGLLFGLAIILLIAIILYRNNQQKQKANQVLEATLTNLKSTQSQLIQSEKMASLGELTAGIAHEIQNPLNFVNNFSEVNTELIDELKTELATGNTQQAIEIAGDIKDNEQKINHHGKRADAIVKGMLQHSRTSTGVKEPTDINALADEYLRLAYHGLRAKDKSFNATMNTNFDETIGKINIIPQDIGRVVLNLLTNAFYVVDEKKKSGVDNYEPTVSISTKKMDNKVEIKVSDNGNGIPQKVLDKIFQPFFTTKPTGQGTGLGLSLSYDIVKAHGGELKVETKEGEGSTFIIQLSYI
jgi:two-component system NtrC family sensor kinase